MPDTDSKAALFRVVDKRADGNCIWATLAPARGGDTQKALFCNADDVAYLKDGSPKHGMATVTAKNGAAARLLPVTVGLDVSMGATSPAGDTTVVALPRPAPLRLPAGLGGVRDVVERAIREKQSVVFALSDHKTVIDAAPIDRETALSMLGMRR